MVLPAAAPALQHGDAIDLGQAEIEDHGVIGLGLAEEVALLAVESLVDGIAGVLQRGHDLAVEVLVVFDDEQSHGRYAPVCADVRKVVSGWWRSCRIVLPASPGQRVRRVSTW